MYLIDKWYMILSALLFALMTMFIKMVSPYLPPYELLFFRFLGGTLICIFTDRFCFRFSKGNFNILFIRSLIGIIAMFAFFTAVYFTSISRVGILHFSFPVYEIIFSALWLKESPRKIIYVSLPLALIGIYYITSPEIYGFNTGDMLALLSGITGGIAIITVRKAIETNKATTIFFYFCLIGMAVAAVPTMLNWVTPQISSIGLIILVVLTGGVGQIIMTNSYKSSSAGEGSIISLVTVVFINLLGFIFLKEKVTFRLFTGELLVLISVALLMKEKESNLYLE